MGNEVGVYSEKQVKALGRSGRATLRKEAHKLIRSRSMRKFINRDPVGQIIHSHPQIRRKLKAKLRSTYERLKAAAP